MKSTNTIQRILRNTAAFENKADLWSEEELHALLNNAPVAYPSLPPSHRPLFPTRRTLMIGSPLVLGAVASCIWYISTNTQIHEPQTHSQSEVLSRQYSPQRDTPALKKAPVHVNTDCSRPPASAQQMQTVANDRIVPKNPASIATLQNSVGAVKNRDIKVPERISGINVLDISPEQALKLGVVITNDSVFAPTQLAIFDDNPSSLRAFIAHQQSSVQASRSTVSINAQAAKRRLQAMGFSSEESSVMNFQTIATPFGLTHKLLSKAQVESQQARVFPVLVTSIGIDDNAKSKTSVGIFSNPYDKSVKSNELAEQLTSLYDLYVPDKVSRSETVSTDTKNINDSRTPQRDASPFTLLAKLVPVRITLGYTPTTQSEVLLWYYPSDEFLSLIPTESAEQIRKERDETLRLEQQPTGIRREFTGEYSYTDVARSQSGAIEIISIGPNPAQAQATIRLRVSQPRQAAQIVLYDMMGARVGVLSTINGLSTDASIDIPIDVHAFSTGAYLVAVVTPEGENAIQRLIIQH